MWHFEDWLNINNPNAQNIYYIALFWYLHIRDVSVSRSWRVSIKVHTGFFLWISTVESAYNMSSLIFYTHSLDNTCLTQKNGDIGGPLTNVHLWPLMSCRFHLKFQVHSHPPAVLWVTITLLLFTILHALQKCLVYIPNLNSNLFLIHVNEEFLYEDHIIFPKYELDGLSSHFWFVYRFNVVK